MWNQREARTKLVYGYAFLFQGESIILMTKTSVYVIVDLKWSFAFYTFNHKCMNMISKWHQSIHQYNSSKDIDVTYSNAKVEYRSHDNPDRDPDEVVRSNVYISHCCLPPCAHSDTCRPYPTGSEMACSFLTAGAHDPSRYIAGRAVVTRKDRLDAVE